MDFLIDNAVALSAIFLGVVVLIALAVAALAGFRLWRTIKRTQRILTERVEALAADAQRVSAAAERLPQRQAEVTDSLASLRSRAAAIGVVGKAAGEAAVILRAPLRYLSG